MLTVITPPTTSDLTVLATATRELRLTLAEETTGLADLICEASAICGAYCKRPEGFGLATVRQTERLVRPRDAIILERDLAPTITTITEDGTALTAGTDFELDGALLYRLSSGVPISWSTSPVVVTYTAGYTLLTGLPADIERACLLVIAQLHAARGANPSARTEDNGLTRTSMMDMPDGLPPQAAALLAPYRRVVV